VPAQAPEHAEIELAALLVDDQLDIRAGELVDAARVAGPGAYSQPVSQPCELPPKQNDLPLGAAEGKAADDEQDPHREAR